MSTRLNPRQRAGRIDSAAYRGTIECLIVKLIRRSAKVTDAKRVSTTALFDLGGESSVWKSRGLPVIARAVSRGIDSGYSHCYFSQRDNLAVSWRGCVSITFYESTFQRFRAFRQ